MSNESYIVRWLIPDDAEQIAALEARVHVSEHRAGRSLIWEQLALTEGDGRNLSLGLYRGSQLVGFGLAFVMSSRREMAEFFDAPLPPHIDPEQSTLYIADWVVEPEHRRAVKLMSTKFAQIVRGRADLDALPADAFATDEYAEKWSAPNAYFAKLGWKFAGRHAFHDARLGKTLHWLNFDRTASSWAQSRKLALLGDPARSTIGWNELRDHWAALLDRDTDATVLQSWAYLSTWFAHIGVIEQECSIAVSSHGQIVAVAPLQIAAVWQRGRHKPTLRWPSEAAGAQTSRPLLNADDEAASAALAAWVVREQRAWEAIDLDIHPAQSMLAQQIGEQLRQERVSFSTREGRIERRIEISGTWPEYLASRARPLRERLEASGTQLSQSGALRFEMNAVSTLESLDRYYDLEHYAPDDEAWLGACASSRHMSFYRALVVQHARELGIHAGYLYAGDQVAAGLLAFLWRGQLHLVHITRPEAFAPANADYLALARVVEWCFQQRACSAVDISALVNLEPEAWATRNIQHQRLRADRNALPGWLAKITERFTS